MAREELEAWSSTSAPPNVAAGGSDARCEAPRWHALYKKDFELFTYIIVVEEMFEVAIYCGVPF